MQQAEVARDTEATGVVIARLRLAVENPTRTQMMTAIRKVVQDGKSSNTAYRVATKTIFSVL